MNYRTDDRVEGHSPIPQELEQFMHRVSISRGSGWRSRTASNAKAYAVPESVDTRCGYCGSFGALLFCKEVGYNGETDTLTLQARCTRDICQQKSTVLIIKAIEWVNYQNGYRSEDFWILPKPEIREIRFETEDIDELRIFTAYRNAIESFNDSRPSQAITACGQVIEGIGKTKFPGVEGSRNIGGLFRKLEEESKKSPEFKDVLDPLTRLGKALALGRNPGGHFFFEVDPDLELASKIIDLTEFLIQYIFTIGKETENVRELMKNCNPLESEEEESIPLAAGQIPAPPMAEVVVDPEDGRAGTAP
jgi:hypothetical protein